jgi:phosphinothricin acetyltransferase
VTFEEVAPTVVEMEQRIRKVTAQFPWLVCSADGRVAGYAYAATHRERAAYRWAVETAAYVSEGHRGRGIGRALYFSLTRLLRAQGYHRAFGLISLPNPASVALHESAGFKPKTVFKNIGYKSGDWRDVGWWECPLTEPAGKPSEPLAISQLVGGPHWNEAIAAGESLLEDGTGR